MRKEAHYDPTEVTITTTSLCHTLSHYSCSNHCYTLSGGRKHCGLEHPCISQALSQLRLACLWGPCHSWHCSDCLADMANHTSYITYSKAIIATSHSFSGITHAPFSLSLPFLCVKLCHGE